MQYGKKPTKKVAPKKRQPSHLQNFTMNSIPVDLKRHFAATCQLRGWTMKRALVTLMKLLVENPSVINWEDEDPEKGDVG